MNQQHEVCMLLRAVSGAQADDIICQAQRLAQRAGRVEVSLASPCSEATHRALTSVGVVARVESLHSWIEGVQSGARAYVVGPGRASAAAWRRLACELQEGTSCSA